MEQDNTIAPITSLKIGNSYLSKTFPGKLYEPPLLITPEGQLWEKGFLTTPKLIEIVGFQCLGHSNWTICITLSPFCSENFPTFHLHYGEPILITPEGQ